MKFIFADAIDQIDPNFDFILDESRPGRRAHRDDLYAHEYFELPPYDGVLISRAIVGDSQQKGKYSDALAMRLRREGARSVLRMNTPRLKAVPIFGDCGAFSYVDQKVPPYSPEDTAEFYADGGFTHGCSPDHIIFGFRPEHTGLEGALPDERERFEITQENARAFFRWAKGIPGFTPLGTIQGWSPDSLAIAAKNLERMGFKYLAIGGMVPLEAPQILKVVRTIRSKIKPSTELHILGFAKAESIHEFVGEGVASFDSTSPLLRAFKDATANYYVRRSDDNLDYFTAIRVPQATENRKLVNAAREGLISQEEIGKLESRALSDLRRFDREDLSLEDTVGSVSAYLRVFLSTNYRTPASLDKAMHTANVRLARTLKAAPWRHCSCKICREVGIEVMIFRTSNRNKRRGFHNLHVYYEHLKRIRDGKDQKNTPL